MMHMLRSWLTRHNKAVKCGLDIAGLGEINSYPILYSREYDIVQSYIDIDKKMIKRYPHLVGLGYRIIESMYNAMCSSNDPNISIARGRNVLASIIVKSISSKSNPCENCSSKPGPWAGMESYYDCYMCQHMN